MAFKIIIIANNEPGATGLQLISSLRKVYELAVFSLFHHFPAQNVNLPAKKQLLT